MEKGKTEADLRLTLSALVSVSTYDWLYADLYLCRAEELLSGVFTLSQYKRSAAVAGQLSRLTETLRQAALRADLNLVRKLADEGLQALKGGAEDAVVRKLGEQVYGPRHLVVEPRALELAGAGVQSHQLTAHARQRVLSDLRILLSHDAQLSPLYRARLHHFERFEIVADERSTATAGSSVPLNQLFDAIEHGDFARVRQLASPSGHQVQTSATRVHSGNPIPAVAANLARPFPDQAGRECVSLGLASEVLDTFPAANHYLGCPRTDRARTPASSMPETDKTVATCACGYPGWPDIPATLCDNLDLLMVHRLVTFAGTRYLPWFGPEAMLVETFPEPDCEAPSELLRVLDLPRRKGLSRLQIEDSLRRNGPKVCTALGLNPIEFTVACIPFDAYVRLAAQYSWGDTEQWTHFDGYQLMRRQRLCALVGGDVRFGGANDLCSVGRDYDSDRLVARFAILRRQRFVENEL